MSSPSTTLKAGVSFDNLVGDKDFLALGGHQKAQYLKQAYLPAADPNFAKLLPEQQDAYVHEAVLPKLGQLFQANQYKQDVSGLQNRSYGQVAEQGLNSVPVIGHPLSQLAFKLGTLGQNLPQNVDSLSKLQSYHAQQLGVNPQSIQHPVLGALATVPPSIATAGLSGGAVGAIPTALGLPAIQQAESVLRKEVSPLQALTQYPVDAVSNLVGLKGFNGSALARLKNAGFQGAVQGGSAFGGSVLNDLAQHHAPDFGNALHQALQAAAIGAGTGFALTHNAPKAESIVRETTPVRGLNTALEKNNIRVYKDLAKQNSRKINEVQNYQGSEKQRIGEFNKNINQLYGAINDSKVPFPVRRAATLLHNELVGHRDALQGQIDERVNGEKQKAQANNVAKEERQHQRRLELESKRQAGKSLNNQEKMELENLKAKQKSILKTQDAQQKAILRQVTNAKNQKPLQSSASKSSNVGSSNKLSKAVKNNTPVQSPAEILKIAHGIKAKGHGAIIEYEAEKHGESVDSSYRHKPISIDSIEVNKQGKNQIRGANENGQARTYLLDDASGSRIVSIKSTGKLAVHTFEENPETGRRTVFENGKPVTQGKIEGVKSSDIRNSIETAKAAAQKLLDTRSNSNRVSDIIETGKAAQDYIRATKGMTKEEFNKAHSSLNQEQLDKLGEDVDCG